MNIDDVKEVPQEVTLEMVFSEQERLMAKYQDIEGRAHDLNLDTREGQTVVKDFLWRITEEIGEALDSELGDDHVREELADALHFLIELSIISGCRGSAYNRIYNYPFLPKGKLTYDATALHPLVVALAKVGRTCKNKPWKQTQIPIDMVEYSHNLIGLVHEFLAYCQWFFESQQQLYQFYFKKAQVNRFRQRSGY